MVFMKTAHSLPPSFGSKATHFFLGSIRFTPKENFRISRPGTSKVSRENSFSTTLAGVPYLYYYYFVFFFEVPYTSPAKGRRGVGGGCGGGGGGVGGGGGGGCWGPPPICPNISPSLPLSFPPPCPGGRNRPLLPKVSAPKFFSFFF